MDFLTEVTHFEKEGVLPADLAETLRNFYSSYLEAIIKGRGDIAPYLPWFNKLLELVIEQVKTPYKFEPFHQKITQPFDYYHFGMEFIRPLVVMKDSKVLGLDFVEEITQKVKKGENVIFLANHQIELDPQAITLLLEKTHHDLAEEMIFVAGHRVVTDPVSIPFSKGRNLLCINSKKYMEHPPEKKDEKLRHNQNTMKRMRELLSEGGKCIYVAPSGGRDRRNSEGVVEVAPFDPQSIEMFLLMAKKADKKTHFYPLALSTYNLLPPPDTIQIKLGEIRKTQVTPIHLAFGAEIDMADYPGCENPDKKERRSARARLIWNKVNTLYEQL